MSGNDYLIGLRILSLGMLASIAFLKGVGFHVLGSRYMLGIDILFTILQSYGVP